MSSTDSSGPPKIRHEWYQTDTSVVVSVFIRNVDPANLTVDLEANSVSVNVKLPTGSDVVFDLDPLSFPIDPQASSFRVLAPKIELTLVKQTIGIKWTKLEQDADQPTPVPGATISAPTTSGSNTHAYPSSSKKRTNWDSLVKDAADEDDELAKQMSKDANAGGDVALNQMFQKLYEGATDEQRRAMIKSYQESNGTSLSTDWSTVGKGKVETHPPDSMIAKKWNE